MAAEPSHVTEPVAEQGRRHHTEVPCEYVALEAHVHLKDPKDLTTYATHHFYCVPMAPNEVNLGTNAISVEATRAQTLTQLWQHPQFSRDATIHAEGAGRPVLHVRHYLANLAGQQRKAGKTPLDSMPEPSDEAQPVISWPHIIVCLEICGPFQPLLTDIVKVGMSISSQIDNDAQRLIGLGGIDDRDGHSRTLLLEYGDGNILQGTLLLHLGLALNKLEAGQTG